MSWATELLFAQHLADVADAISMRYFRRGGLSVRAKPDGTPVTEADELVEQTLRREIRAAHPDHGVLGEEEGDAGGSGSTRWIIDPIDGTKNFSWGIPVWATLIALEVDDRVVCGVVSAPALGDRWTAALGQGALRNDEPIRVSEVSDLSQARLGYTTAHHRGPFADAFAALLGRVAHDRGLGDFWGHVLVASGSLDVMIEPALAPWDVGPLVVLLEEAGGRLTDFAGTSHAHGGSCLSTNGLLHDEVLGIVGAGR